MIDVAGVTAIEGYLVDFFDGVPDFLIVAAAVLTAAGVVWRKGIVPVRDFVRRFKLWMDRTERALDWVDKQMRPNGGKTLVDKVDMLLQHDAERDATGFRYGNKTLEEGDK